MLPLNISELWHCWLMLEMFLKPVYSLLTISVSGQFGWSRVLVTSVQWSIAVWYCSVV